METVVTNAKAITHLHAIVLEDAFSIIHLQIAPPTITSADPNALVRTVMGQSCIAISLFLCVPVLPVAQPAHGGLLVQQAAQAG